MPSNSELRVSIWRLTGAQKVWYEWMAEAFLPVSSHVGSGTGASSQGMGTPPNSGSPGRSNTLAFNATTTTTTAPSTPPQTHQHIHQRVMRSEAPAHLHMSPRVNGAGALVTPTTTYAAMPSPLLDALDSGFGGRSRCATPIPVLAEDDPVVVAGGAMLSVSTVQVVKIGQTSLHNPGGRSSWVGL